MIFELKKSEVHRSENPIHTSRFTFLSIKMNLTARLLFIWLSVESLSSTEFAVSNRKVGWL